MRYVEERRKLSERDFFSQLSHKFCQESCSAVALFLRAASCKNLMQRLSHHKVLSLPKSLHFLQLYTKILVLQSKKGDFDIKILEYLFFFVLKRQYL